MSEDKSTEAKFDKGDRAAIVKGRKGVGVRGEVFWVGPNKYGPGMRFGLKGDDGQTYWVDESELGSEADAPPAPPPPPAGPVLDKGDRAEITSGKDAGKQGEVFWTGQSRYSNQMRYGIKDDDGETYWVDQPQIKKVGGPTNDESSSLPDEPFGGPSEEPPPADPNERRLDDDLPPEAMEGGEDPDFFNDPDEDIPF